MKMANMTKAPAKETSDKAQPGIDTPSIMDDGPSVHLSEHHIKKLGLSKIPRLGEHLVLHARAHVDSVNQHKDSKGKANRSMSLTITHMAVNKRPAPSSGAEAVRNGIEDADGAGDA